MERDILSHCFIFRNLKMKLKKQFKMADFQVFCVRFM